MARQLTPDRPRATIAILAAIAALAWPAALGQVLIIAVAALLAFIVAGSFGQILTIATGALLGLLLCRGITAADAATLHVTLSRRLALGALALFVLLFAAGALLAPANHAAAVFHAFYRSGALVFGGGHVVLPLLSDAVVRPGWISPADFLTGYGAAQAVPGPLFTISAYMGALLAAPPNGALGAVIALIAIFLPGLLLVTGALPFWDALRRRPDLQAAMRGINAAVVGILGAALYSPLWTSAITNWRDAALAAVSFALLVFARLPSWTIVLGAVIASGLMAVSG
jgi:chromate transporter